jgi:hypothetical protein
MRAAIFGGLAEPRCPRCFALFAEQVEAYWSRFGEGSTTIEALEARESAAIAKSRDEMRGAGLEDELHRELAAWPLWSDPRLPTAILRALRRKLDEASR